MDFNALNNPHIVCSNSYVSDDKDMIPAGFSYGQSNSKISSDRGKAGKGKTTANHGPKTPVDLDSVKLKRAWEIAFGPAKSVPLNLIMSYMTGNSLQIIPVTMAFMFIWNPVKAIVNETSRNFESLKTKHNSGELVLAKVAFVTGHVACMLIGVYKLYYMGLIPHTEADWLAWKQPIQFTESLL